MNSNHRRIRFLASVRSVEEARLVTQHGADIVDCKEPAHGALGALDGDEIRAICNSVGVRVEVSATIGDDTADLDDVAERVRQTAESGVNFVKIGIPGGTGGRTILRHLDGIETPGCRLVAVLLADQGIDMALMDDVAAAGFAGVLLDTADKSSGALPDIVSGERMSAFIARARNLGLFAGLAGALRVEHVSCLKSLNPDILGFRGALCHDRNRGGDVDAGAVARIAIALAKQDASAGVGVRQEVRVP